MRTVFIRGNSGDFSNYTAALSACGAQPVLSMNLEDAAACSGLLLPGGADMDPVLYGQANTASRGIDADRDRDELALIHLFFEAKKPILGVCRGHQVLNVAFGGDLIQDVPVPAHHVDLGEAGDNVHAVHACHPFLCDVYGDNFCVNSAHHQAVGKLGRGLLATCTSADGINEGFIHENGLVIGVQFHPERMAFAHRRADTVDGASIWEAFVRLLKDI